MVKRVATDEPAAPAAQKSKKISKQEVDARKNELKKMSDFMQSVDDLLCQIKQKPSIYAAAPRDDNKKSSFVLSESVKRDSQQWKRSHLARTPRKA